MYYVSRGSDFVWKRHLFEAYDELVFRGSTVWFIVGYGEIFCMYEIVCLYGLFASFLSVSLEATFWQGISP